MAFSLDVFYADLKLVEAELGYERARTVFVGLGLPILEHLGHASLLRLMVAHHAMSHVNKSECHNSTFRFIALIECALCGETRLLVLSKAGLLSGTETTSTKSITSCT